MSLFFPRCMSPPPTLATKWRPIRQANTATVHRIRVPWASPAEDIKRGESGNNNAVESILTTLYMHNTIYKLIYNIQYINMGLEYTTKMLVYSPASNSTHPSAWIKRIKKVKLGRPCNQRSVYTLDPTFVCVCVRACGECFSPFLKARNVDRFQLREYFVEWPCLVPTTAQIHH